MRKLKILLITLGLCFSATSWAQDTVTGVITDADNVPIPGASIIIKGTSKGKVTDFDGNYEMKVKKGDVLEVSYLGYATKTITYAGQSKLNVKLEQSSSELDEVVVVGYGTVKKKDLTGAVVSMDAKQIAQTNKVDAISALQGQAPGVVIQRTSNKPGGGGFNIRIRGASTINTNQTASNGGFSPGQNPLFIVDGIFVKDISFLNPADISRMDVLKDASSTAIYGSRGSNGVVLIETKSGKSGKLKVSYSNYVGFKQAYNLPKMQDGPGYVNFVKDDVVGNKFAAGNFAYRKKDVVLSDYLSTEELKNVADGVNTNWPKLLLKNGFQTNHTLNLSGGNDKTTYSTGLAYTNDNGTIGGSNFTRYNIRANVKSDLTKWMNLSVNNYVTNAVQNTGSWEAFRSSYRLKPIGRPYNDDGSLRFYPTAKERQITNPLFEQSSVTRNTKYMEYVGGIALKITPLKGFTLSTKFSPNIKYTRYGEYRGLKSKSTSNNPSNRRAEVRNTNYFSYSWDNILNYKYKKGVHAVNFTGIFSRVLRRTEQSDVQVRNFATDNFKFYNLGAASNIKSVSSTFSKLTLQSYTARLNYSLKDKYLLTVTGRYDGASLLAKGNKWAFFPSAALAWKIMEEDFMKKQHVFSNAKLRLSYGQTGNNGQGGGLIPLGSKSLLNSSATNLGGSPAQTLSLNGLANQNLKWERTSEVNLGFDYGFLNNRITGSIDVYSRKSTNIIFGVPTTTVIGVKQIYKNIGASTNKGIEIGLNTVNINSGNFKWKTNFNFAANTNKITKLYGSNDHIFFSVNNTNLIHKVGEPIGSVYDYQYDGIWQLDQAAEAAKYGQKPGQVRVKDLNNDGKIDPLHDKKVLGRVTPKWTGGVTSTMNYKNFDFTFFVRTSQGNMVQSNFHNATSFAWDNQPTRLFNGYKVNYWTPTNPTNDWYQPGNGGIYQNVIKYKNVSFTKVGYITLGYKLPSSILDKIKIASLRIYATVQNPFVFTKYDGWDPENAGRNQWGATFMSRTFMTGVNINF